ncbi:MAG TPA: DMT family transporter [Anaerolineales bacterium]|nr:DMT family transporter [Anaerolineales bacterium]
MPILAIALLLTSAVLHALWNLLLKQAPEKYVAMGWQVIISGVISFVLLFFTGLPPRSMWVFAAVSMTLEAIYFVLLSFAYRDHDFSLVYPVARGAAPALVVLWSFLFLHEVPSVVGFIGIITIILGLIIVGGTNIIQEKDGKPQLKGIAIALSISLIISIYTIVDGFAVKHGPALPYGLAMFTLVPVLTSPVIVSHYGWEKFIEGRKKQPARLILVGFLGVIAYLLALFAYSLAPVNYSEAIREVSVVMGAFAGWQFLGEKLGKIRVLGTAVIFAGIVLIAIFG